MFLHIFIVLLIRVVMMSIFFLSEGRKRLNRLCRGFADTGLVPKDT